MERLSDFNILCFTETHLHYNVPNEDLFIKGFQTLPFRKDVSPILLDESPSYIGEGLTAVQRFDLEANLDESLWTEIKQEGESI